MNWVAFIVTFGVCLMTLGISKGITDITYRDPQDQPGHWIALWGFVSGSVLLAIGLGLL